MTTTETVTGRQRFPRIIAADEALAAFNAGRARSISFASPPFGLWSGEVYDKWVTEHRAIAHERTVLVAEITAACEEARGLMCTKCGGKGTKPRHRHVANGVCFQCDGWGLTAKGRRRFKVGEQA